MDAYQHCLKAMEELFAKDCTFSLATARDNIPTVRVVDAFFDDGAFYVVTWNESGKAREIRENANVSLCSGLYRFSGAAVNIGHPLRPENAAIRAKLIEAFTPWYFRHNDEGSEGMCYLKITPAQGFVYKDGTGWEVNFAARTAREFPFLSDIISAE